MTSYPVYNRSIVMIFLLHSGATKRTSVLSLAVPLYRRPDFMLSVGKFQLAVPRKYFTVLIKFMELIPCKADSRSNSPETPHLLRNSEIYFHVHKCFKVVPVLAHIMQFTTCHRMSSISNFLSSPKYPSVFKVVNSFQNVAVL